MSRDYECESYVDVVITNKITGNKRVVPEPCHVTPKRIYTIGGSVYDKTTGKRIMRLEHRVWGDYVWRALPETIRKTKELA